MFQLTESRQVAITKANTRTEIHGKERVRAIDICWELKGENTLLDLIEPGLREHHYRNKALDAKQESLPEMLVPLPDLRFPALPLEYTYKLGATGKLRGYRFQWDWGTQEEHVDFSDVALSKLAYELEEGGSVTIRGTVQYNGPELADNTLYGELGGLGTDGDIYIRLLAPGEPIPAKKGYRAGKPDTPQASSDDGDQHRIDGDDGDDDAGGGGPDGDGDDDQDGALPPGSPEAALAGTEPEGPTA